MSDNLEDATILEVGQPSEETPEETADEAVETEDVEDPTPDNTDETSEEAIGDDPESLTEDESVEWNDWAKQYELPEDIKSPEDLAERYLAKSKAPEGSEMSPELAKVDALLKAQGIEGGVQALMAGNASVKQPEPQTDQPTTQSFFPDNPFTSQAETMIKEGLIKEEDAASYKAVARFNDQAMSTVTRKITDVLSALSQTTLSNRDAINNYEWANTAKALRGTGVQRAEIDSLKRLHNFKTYDEALHFYAITKDPSLLQKMQKNAEERGTNKGRKKLKRSTSMRKGGSKATSTPAFDPKRWTNADGSLDRGKLATAGSIDNQLKIAEAYEKWAAKRK